jgi:hypothetical protein
VTLRDGWGEYEFTLPAAFLNPGLNEIVAIAGGAAAPAEVAPGSDDHRRLSVAVDWVRVDVR